MRDRKNIITLIAGMLVMFLLAGAPTAFAATTHPFSYEFSAGSSCSPEDVMVVESTGLVYVECSSPAQIRRFHLNGAPAPFSASVPYVSGNAITASPNPNGSFAGQPTTLAVDTSGGPNDGFLYVASQFGSGKVDIFEPSGKWFGLLPAAQTSGAALDVDVDRKGFIYVGTDGGEGEGHISKYTPAFHEAERIWMGKPPSFKYVRVDSTGAVWFNDCNFVCQGPLFKFEADQFSTNLKTDPGAEEDPVEAALSPFSPQPLLPAGTFSAFDVDPASDDLYVNLKTGITSFSRGVEGDPAHQNGPEFGAGKLTASAGVDVTEDGQVYATTSANKVVVFAPGEILPTVTSNPPEIPGLGHESAEVSGHIDLAGGEDITDCEVQYGTTTSYGSVASCSPDPEVSNFTEATKVSATLPGLSIGTTYHYRFAASNVHGQNIGGDRTVSPVAVLGLTTDPATDIDTDGATLNGSLNPDSMETTYHFEYGLTTDYRQRTAEFSTGPAAEESPVSIPVDTLQAGRVYHYRLVGENVLGTTHGPDETLRIAAAPQIGGVRATDLSATGAILRARIDSVGYATKYRFQYGTTPAYGASLPVPDGELEASATSQEVAVELEGLQPGVVYHFRVVAVNQWGERRSDNTTFTFSPPDCPNAHVRQQTGSAFLPDCRAYELVSPADAGSAQLFPSKEILDFGRSLAVDEILPFAQSIQNTGLATSPPRFMFYGGLGAVPGLDAPNSVIDAYLATRTNQGWVTTLPGLTGSETVTVGRRQCSLALDKCIDHRAFDVLASDIFPDESAPYLFEASGQKLGQLPTNVDEIPAGNRFHGDRQMSGNFTHFVFSSREIPFAPGGATEAPGSAYANDLSEETLSVISKLPNGEDIPSDGGGAEEFISFPPKGVSPDGSHILMRTKAPGGTNHLYMRVDDAVTYDVARGFGVDLVGMTANGTKVYFAASEQVVPAEDTDTSTDLYLWDEQGDTVTLVSRGNGQGNSDSCDPSETSNCDVGVLETERGDRDGFDSGGFDQENAVVTLGGTDSKLATQSGDVYFYSPENLDPGNPGVPNERNLYVFRNGAVQLVATLDPGTKINRIQISPDGSHAAFVTAARLTGYDNEGFHVMYTFDAETGAIRCVSCNPSGAPPFTNVSASEGGPFMSDDGRAFFATKEALVPRDSNGLIDVYEFVDGQPQLISTGLGDRDFAASGLREPFFVPEHIGLEAVSANGVDVYFSTYETLVPQDENGSFVKFYNARTGGGFEPVPPLAPCVAADECHGVGSSPLALPQIPTSGDLGAGGNVRKAAKPKSRKKSRKKSVKKRASRHKAKRATAGR